MHDVGKRMVLPLIDAYNREFNTGNCEWREVTFEDVRKEGSTITAKANHNCEERLFNVRIEGVTTLDRSDGLKLFTEPEEYATEEFAIKGATSLLREVLKTKQDYIERTGFVYAMWRCGLWKSGCYVVQ